MAAEVAGDHVVPLLRLDPMFDPLRNDRRFQKLTSDTVKAVNK
jgi:hypothetical protein